MVASSHIISLLSNSVSIVHTNWSSRRSILQGGVIIKCMMQESIERRVTSKNPSYFQNIYNFRSCRVYIYVSEDQCGRDDNTIGIRTQDLA